MVVGHLGDGAALAQLPKGASWLVQPITPTGGGGEIAQPKEQPPFTRQENSAIGQVEWSPQEGIQRLINQSE